jgi:hypothetical protein
MEFWAAREGDHLRPVDAESAAVLSKLRMGKPLKIDVRQPRHGGRHRLFWVMCTRIANAIGAEPENVSDLLKVQTGHCTIVKAASGTYKFPRSISYASMDDTAHSAFFERCIQVIQTEWGIARPDILRELSDILETQTEVRA